MENKHEESVKSVDGDFASIANGKLEVWSPNCTLPSFQQMQQELWKDYIVLKQIILLERLQRHTVGLMHSRSIASGAVSQQFN